MKRYTKPLIAAALLAGGALAAVPVVAEGLNGHPGADGRGMGPGMMGSGMMGSGMMTMMLGGGAMHPEMMAAHGGTVASIETAEDVETLLGKHLEWMGNDRLKVGSVEKAGEDTWVAEIVTVDGSLVNKVEVNGKTGFMHHAR